MKISRAALYALNSSLMLADAGPGRPVPCRQLAEQGQMPERFLLQVLRMMVNAGLLASTRGVEGGYRLARPPQQITLLEVVEATQGRLEPEPLNMPHLPSEATQRLASCLAAAVENQRQHYARLTLDVLLPSEPNREFEPARAG